MTDITALAQREKFEAWLEEAEALPWGYLKKRRTSDDAYHEPNTTDLWGAWQAATAEMVEALEKAQQRIGELERSHKTLRETMAGIHNTIRTDGGYTPLVSILNASKRAYEESAAAAGIQVIEGEGQ